MRFRGTTSDRMAWYGYDVGNTAIEFVVALYLGQWLMLDRGISAKLYGVLFAVMSSAIVVTGPYIGVLLDRYGVASVLFRATSLTAGIMIAALSFMPEGATGNVATLLVAGAGLYMFAIAAIIYNSALVSASKGVALVRTSAFGTAASYCGGILGIAIIATIIGESNLAGVHGRRLAFLSAGLFFLLIGMPAIASRSLWPSIGTTSAHISSVFPWKLIVKDPSIRHLCVAYGLSNMCIVGMLLYIPLYLRERGMGDNAIVAWFLWGAAWAGAGAASNVLWMKGRTTSTAMGLAMTACFVGITLFGLGRGLVALGIGMALESAGAGSFIAAIRAAFSEALPAREQATGFGIVGSVQRLSGGMGALMVPLMMLSPVEFGITPILGCAVAGCGGAAVLFSGAHMVRHGT